MDKDSDSSADSMPNEQQGIFSTPELTIDAEKLAQNAEEINASSRAKIASIFANTETGQQAQKLNDAMAAATAPATEDIVIDNGVKKKKKWPIMVGITALIVIVGGVGMWFLVDNLNRQDQTAASVPVSLKDSFNAYMNYLAYGTDSTVDFLFQDFQKDYSVQYPYNIYAESVIAGLEDGVDRETYIERLYEKYNSLASAYEAANDGEQLSSAIKDYFYDYANMPALNSAAITQIYIDQGEAGAKQTIDEYYNIDQASEDLKKYAENQRTIASLEVSIIKVATENNCMVDYAIQEVCLQDHFGQVDTAIIDAAGAAYDASDAAVLNMRSSAMNELAYVSEQIYPTSDQDTGATV